MHQLTKMERLVFVVDSWIDWWVDGWTDWLLAG